jgi:hypothetical protein
LQKNIGAGFLLTPTFIIQPLFFVRVVLCVGGFPFGIKHKIKSRKKRTFDALPQNKTKNSDNMSENIFKARQNKKAAL